MRDQPIPGCSDGKCREWDKPEGLPSTSKEHVGNANRNEKREPDFHSEREGVGCAVSEARHRENGCNCRRAYEKIAISPAEKPAVGPRGFVRCVHR